MRKIFGRFAVLAIIISLPTLVAFANEGISVKIHAGVVEAIQKSQRVDVLLFLEQQANLGAAKLIVSRKERVQYVYDQLRMQAEFTQIELLKNLEELGLNYRPFHIVNAVAVFAVDKDQLDSLSKRKDIAKIVLNGKHRLQLPNPADLGEPVPTEAESFPFNITEIKAERVWSEFNVRGDGIVIAGQDTGYEWHHPAIKLQYRGYLAGSVFHNFNWHNAIHSKEFGPIAKSCASGSEPCDDSGHGTHTMGNMVGDDGADNKIGVAPNAQWIGCRNMDGGVGTPATYLECFEWLLAPYPNGGNSRTDGRADLAPHIINNSWSCPPSEGCAPDTLLETVRAMKAAGIMVVVAAGNDGSSCGSVSDSPGSYAGELLSTAAWNYYGREIAFFSSRGPSAFNGGLAPDITAPGTPVRSSVPGGGYDSKGGTSMASPHVAGVVALMWSANPRLIGNIDRTMEIIHETAEPRSNSETCGGIPAGTFPNNTWGYGMVDAYHAVEAALAEPLPAPLEFMRKVR